ncbi:GntR family transcriptional regulator/MocR family aminotransferase [Peribacillus deserti]|uniref:GntR family transcriptional regulator/MocR family aminotransferase n=1 Tax=Peribacillus deserti TaxID=673318 RepID=A0ABS2QM08_9BACI|nr:PLP-dependent aminotransferase family protein [Peribacillus deserti]MBM7694198.1 GntR family transcriptional regulator/MocR family aminotransferase [Peribacillus deserti]
MDMLSIQLDRADESPLYDQLYEYIKKEIIEGRIVYQTKMPSKRKLSEFLQISQNTVETAYEQLVAEGYLDAFPRKGYYVMAYEDLAYVNKRAVREQVSAGKQENGLFHFHPSRIDSAPFPFSRWRKYAKDLISEEYKDLLSLGDYKGEMELRQEIASYLYHSRGVVCSPEQIIIGSGTEYLLPQLVHLLGDESVYAIEEPGYQLTKHILSIRNKEVIPVLVDEEGVIVEDLKNTGANTAYVTPSHQFPYGSVLSINRRTQLLNWAHSSKAHYIIEDDYDSEFRYTGKSIPSLQSMDKAEKVIYLSTFSKSLMPSLRIGYMVLPPQLLEKYQREFSFYSSSVSRFDQHILARFMKEGDFERHLNRMRKIYRRKLETLVDLLRPYSKTIGIIGESAGLHIILTVDNGLTEEELINKAASANIRIYGLSKYSLLQREEKIPSIVLGFAGIPQEDLETGIGLLLESWGMR